MTIDACGIVENRPIEQRLQGWISCLMFTANYLVSVFHIQRSAEEERLYSDLANLRKRLQAEGFPLPPLPVANEVVRLPDLFIGFDRYVEQTERRLEAHLHPEHLLRSEFGSASLLRRQHSLLTAQTLAEGLCRAALAMEGSPPVPGRLRAPRFISESTKQRISALFWKGLVRTLRPSIDRAYQRMHNAQQISALQKVLAKSVSMRQRATSEAGPYTLN
jgi:hypothetical protein